MIDNLTEVILDPLYQVGDCSNPLAVKRTSIDRWKLTYLPFPGSKGMKSKDFHPQEAWALVSDILGWGPGPQSPAPGWERCLTPPSLADSPKRSSARRALG